MRKYRNIGLLLLAGVAVACQKEDVKPMNAQYSAEAIFFTSPYIVTRSAEMRSGNFNEGDKVGVLGYCRAEYQGRDYSASPWETKKEFASPDVFYNQPLEYQGNGMWNYTWDEAGNINGLHPWLEAEDYTYAFFAYYPYAELGRGNSGMIYGGVDGQVEMGTIELSGEDETGDPTITYTMPHNGDRTNSHLELDVVPDLMLAYNTDNQTKNDGPVSLNFRHMLCAFEFRINNYNEEQVTIDALSFLGNDFYKSFRITGQNMDYAPDANNYYSGTFQLISQPIICEAGVKDEVTGVIQPGTAIVGGEESPIDLFFIPDEDGKITAGTCRVTVEMNGEAERTSNLKDGMSFAAGTVSIFNINIIGNNFVIQVETDGRWSDGGDSDIYFD